MGSDPLEAGRVVRRIDGKFRAVLSEYPDGTRDIALVNEDWREVREDKPTFLFRAKDRLALNVLRHYRSLCLADDCEGDHVAGIREMIRKFEQYRADHPELMKQPGVTKGR